MAQNGLFVTAVDQASNVVRIAQEQVGGHLNTNLEVRHVDTAHLPFPDCMYHVVAAIDALCHADDPTPMVVEMFRVCDRHGVVIIIELNAEGRRITYHFAEGFEEKVPALRFVEERRVSALSQEG